MPNDYALVRQKRKQQPKKETGQWTEGDVNPDQKAMQDLFKKLPPEKPESEPVAPKQKPQTDFEQHQAQPIQKT